MSTTPGSQVSSMRTRTSIRVRVFPASRNYKALTIHHNLPRHASVIQPSDPRVFQQCIACHARNGCYESPLHIGYECCFWLLTVIPSSHQEPARGERLGESPESMVLFLIFQVEPGAAVPYPHTFPQLPTVPPPLQTNPVLYSHSSFFPGVYCFAFITISSYSDVTLRGKAVRQ